MNSPFLRDDGEGRHTITASHCMIAGIVVLQYKTLLGLDSDTVDHRENHELVTVKMSKAIGIIVKKST